VVPDRIEFWFGRPNRLHERELYLRADGDPPRWTRELLYP
jgi:pyridoxamine 5'-phosphate oxidase